MRDKIALEKHVSRDAMNARSLMAAPVGRVR